MTNPTYTIRQLYDCSDFSNEIRDFFEEEGPRIAERFGNSFNYKLENLFNLAKKTIFLVCRRNKKTTGYMICYIFNSPLDPEVKILYQLSFYAKPNSGRTAYYLFQKFIDIGKKNAKHIITQLTSQTNIKPSTLENLGFKELETLYRMEI